jgi:hypothetical protein
MHVQRPPRDNRSAYQRFVETSLETWNDYQRRAATEAQS